jgi:hypothetical protein
MYPNSRGVDVIDAYNGCFYHLVCAQNHFVKDVLGAAGLAKAKDNGQATIEHRMVYGRK